MKNSVRHLKAQPPWRQVQFWPMLGVALLFMSLISVATGYASETYPASKQRSPNDPPQPREICGTIFETDFPDHDPLTLSNSDIVIGGESYTSTGGPDPEFVREGTPGVRLRDFFDTLKSSGPDVRPGGANYSDIWAISEAGGFDHSSDGTGVVLGGTGTDNPTNWEHPNHADLEHSLPAGVGLSTNFEISYDILVDDASSIPEPGEGAARGHLSGVSADGHAMNFENGFFGSGSAAQVKASIVDGFFGPPPVWDGILEDPSWPLDHQWHRYRITYYGQRVLAWYNNGGWSTASPPGLLPGLMTQITHVGVNSSVWRRGQTIRAHYSNFHLSWKLSGPVDSVSIPLPAPDTRYGQFNAEHDGDVQYSVFDGSGMSYPIAPGQDLGALGLQPPLRLHALIRRPYLDDPSPVLVNWSVDGCYLAPTGTPSNTPTGTPRTPTPTRTPTATRTPRPTATPRPYISSGLFHPYVHLRVDNTLADPEGLRWPDDETDWTENDPLWYPLQAFGGYVPNAYVDPASPPQLCYWDAAKSPPGWACTNGRVALEGYTLVASSRDNPPLWNPPDQPIRRKYARAHFFNRFNQWQYRYDGSEYVEINWLSPGGVEPACPLPYVCFVVHDRGPGVEQIHYTVNGTITWDAIPGVGGPYEQAFEYAYHVPISLWVPRAEP